MCKIVANMIVSIYEGIPLHENSSTLHTMYIPFLKVHCKMHKIDDNLEKSGMNTIKTNERIQYPLLRKDGAVQVRQLLIEGPSQIAQEG